MGLWQLTRPANVITAAADVLAGVGISGFLLEPFTGEWKSLLLLIISSMCLYACGVVFNDVFDAKLDTLERPERPIPSGLISKGQAQTWGIVWGVAGVLAAAAVGSQFYTLSVFLAMAIVFFSLVYDKWAKHQAIAGPLLMGLCRGLNLLLGISIVPAAVGQYWFLALVPIVYIAAITTISRGEVHGGKKNNLYLALCLYAMVIAALVVGGILQQRWQMAIVPIAGFGWMIFPPLIRAIRQPSGPAIGKAVKAGVIALIIMNAAWAAVFGQLYLAGMILLLLPLSLLLSRFFAVT